MEEYGPSGSLWIAPDGEAWRYQSAHKGFARRGDEILWDQPFYTYYFEVWANRPNSIKNRVNSRGVFGLPDGSVRVWTPND